MTLSKQHLDKGRKWDTKKGIEMQTRYPRIRFSYKQLIDLIVAGCLVDDVTLHLAAVPVPEQP